MLLGSTVSRITVGSALSVDTDSNETIAADVAILNARFIFMACFPPELYMLYIFSVLFLQVPRQFNIGLVLYLSYGSPDLA